MKPRGRRHAHVVRAAPRPGGRAITVELVIDRLGAGGDGIGETPGGRVYVAGALPGERVSVELGVRRGDGWRAGLGAVLEASPDRLAPACGHFGRCGGCALQPLATAAYLDFKRDRILQALARRGMANAEVAAPAASPPGSRRRATFAARRTAGGVVLGFNEAGSDRVVALDECPVLRPSITTLLEPLRALIARVAAPGGTLDVMVSENATGLDVLLTGLPPLDLAAREALAGFAEAFDLARVSIADGPREPTEPVIARRAVLARFAGPEGPVDVALPARAFLQATAEGEAAIVAAVLATVPKVRRAADLFAGCGSLSFALLARAGHVAAFEADASALAALERSARAASLPVSTAARDLDRAPLSPDELGKFDAIVLDPPRAGAVAQATALARSGVPSVTYVSCHPESFARDARILIDGGYRLRAIQPVDQFLWSPHVELVAGFTKG